MRRPTTPYDESPSRPERDVDGTARRASGATGEGHSHTKSPRRRTPTIPVMSGVGTFETSIDVRFSNRPFRVKRFQTIHHYSVDVAHGLVLLFGIGTRGPSIMGFEDEAEQSLPRPCREIRPTQADMRTRLIHRPARDIIPPLGGSQVFLLSDLILYVLTLRRPP